MRKCLSYCLWLLLFGSQIALAGQVTVLKVDANQVIKRPLISNCLKNVLTLLNPTNWYAQGVLTITNNCSTATDLDNAVVSFQSNSQNLTAMWGGPNSSSEFTFKGNIASTVLNITTGPIPVGRSLVLHFGINLTGTPFALTAANNTLTVVPNSPTRADAEIDVTINPKGVTNYTGTSEVQIAGPGLNQPYIITNSKWDSPTTYKVTKLAYGSYTITALPIDNLYLGNTTPSTVTLKDATPVPVAVSYTPKPATGELQINLASAPMTGLANTVDANIMDDTIQQNQAINVAWSSYKLIQNLPVGHHYTITFPEVSNGLSYAVPKPIDHPNILQNRTTNLSVSYQAAQTVPSLTVKFVVAGLASSVTGTINIVDSYGNKFILANVKNGDNFQALPVNDAFAVSAKAPNMYGTVTPSSFTLKSGSEAPDVKVAFQATPPISSGTHFLAFSDSGMQSSGNGLIPPTGSNMVEAFILYNPWKGKSVIWAIEEGDATSDIIKNTPNTFASVGGANGPFPWDNETVDKAITEIENLIDYYHFIGIDFDVEGAALETPTVQDWVTQCVLRLRKDRPNLLLTLTVPDPVIGFTAGTVVIINKTLQANQHKMVFDWVNKMNFDENGLGNGCTQTDPNMNNNCLVQSAIYGAKQLATMLGISEQEAYKYLGETFMIPVDDQGHALPLPLATQVAETIKNLGVTKMGYWRLQNDVNLTYGKMYTHVLGLS